MELSEVFLASWSGLGTLGGRTGVAGGRLTGETERVLWLRGQDDIKLWNIWQTISHSLAGSGLAGWPGPGTDGFSLFGSAGRGAPEQTGRGRPTSCAANHGQSDPAPGYLLSSIYRLEVKSVVWFKMNLKGSAWYYIYFIFGFCYYSSVINKELQKIQFYPEKNELLIRPSLAKFNFISLPLCSTKGYQLPPGLTPGSVPGEYKYQSNSHPASPRLSPQSGRPQAPSLTVGPLAWRPHLAKRSFHAARKTMDWTTQKGPRKKITWSLDSSPIPLMKRGEWNETVPWLQLSIEVSPGGPGLS